MSKADPTMDRVTRVAATATRTRYDATSITLHWVTVALILLQFATAEMWGLFARPTRHVMVVSHMSFGIILSLVVVLRIAWRLVPGHRVEPASTGWDERLAKLVQFALYALLLAQSVLGYIVRWVGGEAMSFFGIPIASPIAAMTRAQHHMLEERHNQIGWAIIVIAAGHAAAAFYHHFKLKDRVLERMLPRRRLQP
ncbi:MAG: cytochrome b [Allosphingosinicella sp.]